jgi:hypothetical protein
VIGCIETSDSRLFAAETTQILPARAVIRFAATSTLHDFDGQLSAEPFTLLISNGTWSASADVLAGQMATENTKRDRNMHRMLGTNDHPRIHGAVAPVPIAGSGGTNVTLNLKIRDRAQDLPVRIMNWTESSGEIRFRAAWELSLKQYGLKPPSVAGIIRVGDTVKLEADVVATKPAPPPAHKDMIP